MLKSFFISICFICFFVPFLAQAITINKIAAVVNGNMITVYDLQKMIAPEMIKNNIDPSNPAHQGTIDSMIRSALDAEILSILIEAEAAKQSITADDAEVEAEISAMMANSGMTKQSFEIQLQREGLTADGLRERIKKGILRQKVMGMMIGRKVVVTKEEIEEYYKKNINNFENAESINLSLIIYPNNVDAQSWADKIKNNTASFAEVARTVSIGPNPQNGGNIGEVPTNEINASLRDQLQTMQVGQVSNIFMIDKNKAQLLLNNRIASRTSNSLEDVYGEIDNILRGPKTMERYDEFQKQLKSKAVIDIRL